MNQKGKVAVVVGGSGIIGSEIVSQLLQAGCNVAVVARSKERFDEHKDQAAIARSQAMFFHADITIEDDVQTCLQKIKSTMGRINFLIYAPGFAPDPDVPLAEYPLSNWHLTFNTYVTGFFLCFREGLKLIKEGGHIVAVSSAVTRFPADKLPPLYAGHYAAAKAGLDELCKWGRREAHERNILLSRVAPGAIDTPFHRAAPTHRRPLALLPAHNVAATIVEAIINGKEVDLEMVATPSV